MNKSGRRSFIKKVAGTAALSTAIPGILAARPDHYTILERPDRRISAADKIRLGAIGMGIQGYSNVNSALQVPGAELAAVCDLYEGRLTSSKENYGNDLITTRNYQEILQRDDIDAVIVSTPDHWHDKIAIEAMEAGKHVYLEKPMVQKIEEGQAIIDAQKKTGKTLQVGSQRVSSILYSKAAEFYASGAIGDLVLAETYYDRFSALGAWQYSIPPDASPDTIDWDRFLGDAPKHDFDPIRFFRWRNYQDYGTGVAGDLFVHLFSGLHVALKSNGPNRIFASGGLRYWKDGRDVPDVMLAVVDYPETDTHSAFNLQIRVNFVDSGGGGSLLRLVGTEGTMTMGWSNIQIRKNKLGEAPGYGGWDSYTTFSKETQEDFVEWYDKKYAGKQQRYEPSEEVFRVPQGYSDHVDHFTAFFEGIKTGNAVVEDPTFGLRAAGPSLATNVSYFEGREVKWDPDQMKITNK
jgi:predicted dehydrogenase